MRVIYACQIEVCINIFPEMNMAAAEIGVKRRFNITVFTDFCKHFFHHSLPLFKFGGAGLIEVIKTVKTFCLPFHNLIVSGKV